MGRQGHAELIWRRRSHDTWCMRIYTINDSRWAQGSQIPSSPTRGRAWSRRCAWVGPTGSGRQGGGGLPPPQVWQPSSCRVIMHGIVVALQPPFVGYQSGERRGGEGELPSTSYEAFLFQKTLAFASSCIPTCRRLLLLVSSHGGMGALGSDRGRDLEDEGGQAGSRGCPSSGLAPSCR
jgi:hypothetical protein